VDRTLRVCESVARSSRVDMPAGARPRGLSGFDVLAWGGQHFVREPRARKLSRPAPGDRGPGLGCVEEKAAWLGLRPAAPGKVDSLATVWISGLFAVVFLMGCLTLG
jgi:hypothetical protein